MADELYWIWLQEALGIGSVKADRVLETAGTAKRFYEMDRAALKELGFLTDGDIARIRSTSLDGAKRLLELAARLKCGVVTPEHPDYPDAYAHIRCKPCVLYVLGTLSFPALSLTLVGTRESSQFGNDAAFVLGRDLASAGCQVVSGLARGIDRHAHEGAISVHGRTVGFLACGMNVDYPRESNRLKRQILDEGGALVTEFPFGREVNRGNFRIRNRLMAGISDGTVVVEAPEHSGALITAQYAADQDRDVFALPGGIMDPCMVGNNRLIRDGGSIVFDVYSILDAYEERLGKEKLGQMTEAVEASYRQMDPGARRYAGWVQEQKQAFAPAKQDPPPPREPMTPEQLAERGVSQTAGQIYAALGDETMDCDELADRTGLSMAEVVAGVTELELTALITLQPGRRYRR